MKRSLVILILVLSATSLWGQARARQTSSKASQSAVSAEDIRELREALAAQQRQIEQLRQELQQRDEQFRAAQQRLQEATTAASEAQNKATAAETTAQEQKDTFTKLANDVKDIQGNMTTTALQAQEEQKRASVIEGVLNRFRFTGDVRVRQEDFFQSHDACPNNGASCNPRIRERIRARFGFEGRPNEDFLAGFAIATGAMTDPTSTNETLTNFFERKTIALDRAYITYNPQAAKWLSLTGGKFAYTWLRSPQTFDNDLNPEGFSQKLSFDLNKGFLKNVTLSGMQLFFNETNRPASASSCVPGFSTCTNQNNVTGGDSFAVGGQVAAKLQLTKSWTLTPSYSLLNWRNNDVILNASSSVTGGSAGPFAPNGITNATVTVGTAGGTTIRRFYSKYLYSDLILDNTIKTGLEKFPLRIFLEYLNNLNAQDHPLLADGTVATDLGKQSHLYKAEANFGQLKSRGDWQFSYGFWRQEQDSAIASFLESDQRAPTNVVQHSLSAQYRVRNNTTLAYTQWIGRTLNSSLQNSVLTPGIAAGQQEPYLKRMQFDVIYSF